MAQCYRNSGSLKNGMAAQAHRTSGSFAPRLFINEAVIKKYIQDQEKYDIAMDKLSVKEYEDPFKG